MTRSASRSIAVEGVGYGNRLLAKLGFGYVEIGIERRRGGANRPYTEINIYVTYKNRKYAARQVFYDDENSVKIIVKFVKAFAIDAPASILMKFIRAAVRRVKVIWIYHGKR